MRPYRLILPLVVVLAACDSKARKDLKALAHADSVRVDSLVSMKNELLNEVMASTQFVSDLNGELAKLKSSTASKKLNTAATTEGGPSIKEQRATIQERIRELVARLDSVDSRAGALRSRAARLANGDTSITGQVAAYERTIAGLRRQVAQQKAEYEATIARQNAQIATLNERVDTITHENQRLSGEKVVLTDSVTQLVTEKNTVYYVIGSKDELVSQGIVVEEGHKRFMFLGGRSLTAARQLDPAKFTRIDRLKDRVINFPAGEYRIISRQNAAFASPFSQQGGTLSGGLRIDQPEHFWEASPFLIIVKA